jgi:hypothetical protein
MNYHRKNANSGLVSHIVKNVELKLNYNSGEFISDSEVILRIPKNEELYRIEAGLATIPGKYIPFSRTHPKDGFRDRDPATVFDQDTKYVGIMGDAWIDYACWPRLRAKINIIDPEVRFLIEQKKVFLSYVYWKDSSPAASFSFHFDHLLIFPQRLSFSNPCFEECENSPSKYLQYLHQKWELEYEKFIGGLLVGSDY